MRYIIIGAGAVGGSIGGRLFDSGHEVVLVARGAHLAALRDHGLRLVVPGGERILSIPAVSGPEEVELRPDDVLILAVKSQDTAATLDAWAGRPVSGGGTAGERLPLLCAQNGVDNERSALRRFRHVYGVCVWLPSSFLEPGVVQAPCTPLTGILHIGRYPGGTDETCRLIADDLMKSVFDAPIHESVMRWKYGKLIDNLGNSVQAVCGLELGGAISELYDLVREEGRQVLAAAGIDFVDMAESSAFRGDRVQLSPDVPRYGGSTWQSLSRGTGSIEADYLNGEIVLLGRMYGVPTRANEIFQREAQRLAREAVPPGSLNPEDLLASIRTAVSTSGQSAES
jgi:2-dehydropantoate 2-reductase